jgi:hypothetical protein
MQLMEWPSMVRLLLTVNGYREVPRSTAWMLLNLSGDAGQSFAGEGLKAGVTFGDCAEPL